MFLTFKLLQGLKFDFITLSLTNSKLTKTGNGNKNKLNV